MAGRYLLQKRHRKVGFIGEITPPEYAIRPALACLDGMQKVLAAQTSLFQKITSSLRPSTRKARAGPQINCSTYQTPYGNLCRSRYPGNGPDEVGSR